MKEKEISKLENQLVSLGLNGLAYSDTWNNIAYRIKELKQKNEK